MKYNQSIDRPNNMCENFLICSYKKKAPVCKRNCPARLRPQIDFNHDNTWNWPPLLPEETVLQPAETHLSLLMGNRLYIMSKFEGPNGHMACGFSMVASTFSLHNNVTLYLIGPQEIQVNWGSSPVLLDLKLTAAKENLLGDGNNQVSVPNVAVCMNSLYYIQEKQGELGLMKISGFGALEGIKQDEPIPDPLPWRFESIPNFFPSQTGDVILKSSKKHLFCYDYKNSRMIRGCGTNPGDLVLKKVQKLPSELTSQKNHGRVLGFSPIDDSILYLTRRAKNAQLAEITEQIEASAERLYLYLCSQKSQRVVSTTRLTLEAPANPTQQSWGPFTGQLQVKELNSSLRLVVVSLTTAPNIGLAAMRKCLVYPIGTIQSQGFDPQFPHLAVEHRTRSVVLKRAHVSFAHLRW